VTYPAKAISPASSQTFTYMTENYRKNQQNKPAASQPQHHSKRYSRASPRTPPAPCNPALYTSVEFHSSVYQPRSNSLYFLLSFQYHHTTRTVHPRSVFACLTAIEAFRISESQAHMPFSFTHRLHHLCINQPITSQTCQPQQISHEFTKHHVPPYLLCIETSRPYSRLSRTP